MDVLDDEERGFGSEPGEVGVDPCQDLLALLGDVHRFLPGWDDPQTATHVGNDPGEGIGTAPDPVAQLGLGDMSEVIGEGAGHRRIRRVRRPEAGAVEDEAAAHVDLGRDRGDQRGLAESGFAGDDRHHASAVRGALPSREQSLALGCSAEQIGGLRHELQHRRQGSRCLCRRELPCHLRELEPVGGTELAEQRRHVTLDCPDRHREPCADLGVGAPVGERVEDITFASGDATLVEERRVGIALALDPGVGQSAAGQRRGSLRSVESTQPDLADRSREGSLRELVADEHLHGLAEDDLAAVRDRPEPGRQVHGRAEIVAVDLVRFARVQRHPHPDRRVLGPHGRSERELCLVCRLDRIRGPLEHAEHRVALAAGLQHEPPVGADRIGDRRVVHRQRSPHLGGVLVPQRRGPDDVGQQKRDHPGRQCGSTRHHGVMLAGSGHAAPPW